jgi:PAS domain S-box-containing protein
VPRLPSPGTVWASTRITAAALPGKKGASPHVGKRRITLSVLSLEHDRWLLAAIVESSDDAIISKSLEGIILSWNKGSEKMFGYTASQALGKPISILIPPGCMNEEKNIIERIRRNEIIDHFETVRIRMNGEPINVSLTVSPLKDKAGKIVGVSKIARNITSRKKLESELLSINKELALQIEEKENRAAELLIANKELAFQNEEKEKRAAELIVANKELVLQNARKEKRAAELIVANNELAFQNEEKEKRASELTIANKDLETSKAKIIEVNKELESFSYSVSHDLRSPLRAINGYTNMLKTNFETQVDPEANRLMNNIVRNANKMGLLIDDLLTFSRVGRRELVKVNISMHSLVQGICLELQAEVPDRNIEFRIDNLLPALADNMAIKQVWVNLLSNAIKYTRLKDPAIIEVSSENNGDKVIYSIKDNGAGFDMRYVDKLFGVFQRLHSEQEFEGTGVGLALVQRIVCKHGGSTWAEGKIHDGATFHFTLNKT